MADPGARYGLTLDQRILRIEKCVVELARMVQILDDYKVSKGRTPKDIPSFSAVESLCLDAVKEARPS
jgi:hypothetical protein